MIVVGVSHKTAPLPIREAVSFPGPKLVEALSAALAGA